MKYRSALLFISVLAAVGGAARASAPDMQLTVDITDTIHRLIGVQERLRVSPGAMTLRYPQWIPGNHAPTGKVGAIAGLTMSAAGKPLAWQRDAQDPYAFHAIVPAGVTMLDIDFQTLGALNKKNGTTFSSPQMVRIDWQSVTLYPAGRPIDAIEVSPSLRIPEKWQVATSLSVGANRPTRVDYVPIAFDTLLDSPAYAARWLTRHLANPGAPKPISIDVAAESEAASHIPPDQLAAYGRAFEQAVKLFGSQPYDHYDFLVTLSSRLSGQGVEHQQSSEDSLPIDYFSDPDAAYTQRNLMVHEFSHAWNGKLHRPAGLIVPDYNTPMQDDLLWVYEGLTTYLDKILTVRAGLWTPQIGRDMFAETYAGFDHEAGRTWRSLQDTTVQPIIGETPAWTDWGRHEDYYEEASLLWLDVDLQIRMLSGGRRSLDDFMRAFLGGGDKDRHVRSYRFADVVAALNTVQPYDWATLLRAHLDSRDAVYPEAGLTRGGYRLTYSDVLSEWTARRQTRTKTIMLDYSLGATIGQDAVVRTTLWRGPAFSAGLLPGDKIISVNGEPFTSDTLVRAIAATKDSTQTIVLAVDGDDGLRTLAIPLRGGLHYAHLEPISGAAPLLDDILRAR